MYETAVYTLVNCGMQLLTHSKQQKSYKDDITHHPIAWLSMGCWIITVFDVSVIARCR